MATRTDLRNVAIIAHVDHGKTTLIDAILRQSGAFGDHEEVADRVLDTGDLEREKGITILAKNTAVRWPTGAGDGRPEEVTVNIIDTPGHADFGGEVERGLHMVDGALLVVDATEGPLPQTRFVLGKALERRLPMILVVNKIDRPEAAVSAVVDEVFQLFLDLGADDEQADFPIVYTDARSGTASLDAGEPGSDVGPLMDVLLDTVPAPTHHPDHPLQALVTNLDASPYLGRLALCRIHHGEIARGQQIARCRRDGTVDRAEVAQLYRTRNLERVEVERAGPGDIVAVAGIDDVRIGETLADPADPRPLPALTVDEPSLGITMAPNGSPLAGRDGDRLTGRQLQSRLERELVGNVALRVAETDRPDTWRVEGRGELQLAVLVEEMRREGFELTLGRPEVVEREIAGRRHEPVERLSVDVPEEHVGVVPRLLGPRRGRMTDMTAATAQGEGWIRYEYVVPARGLIGFRTELMSATSGTAVLHHVFDGWEPWQGPIDQRSSGSLVADRRGTATAYALEGLADRGEMFVEPGDEVYEGMIVGEHNRPEDLDVNVAKQRELSNVRASSADELEHLAPARDMSLEQALEFIRADEAVEVTPCRVRLRKLVLDQGERRRIAKRRKHEREAS